MNETARRIALWTTALGGWGYAVGCAVWAMLEFDPAGDDFLPPWVTLSVFLAMGCAIAAGVALGRINSVRTLSKVFDAGMISARIDRNAHMIDILAAARGIEPPDSEDREESENK
jgi:hypothetical protein